MKIKEDTRKKLIDEIKFIIKKMEKEAEPKQKLFYFSAIYGVVSRIFNLEYDPELVFAYTILNLTYNHINARIAHEEKIIEIPDELFDKLVNASKEFLNKIEKNESLCDALQKFAEIGYATTGNGYYLYQRGLLRL
ncbi:hypothetical protein CEE45_16990 [Candidatus Heimdallarchaeota archaeon B3_Heim]|nr:MAG: hypothetical protein CEE45_16990 [Candidatus Heimdallarchaeota archaeon B3_Heim]